jgi:hypothetical protein
MYEPNIVFHRHFSAIVLQPVSIKSCSLIWLVTNWAKMKGGSSIVGARVREGCGPGFVPEKGGLSPHTKLLDALSRNHP